MEQLGPNEGMNALRHPDCRFCDEYQRLLRGPEEEARQLKKQLAEFEVLRESIIGQAGGKVISGALRSCIDAHGPIESRMIGSAQKRIRMQLRARFDEWVERRIQRPLPVAESEAANG